MCQNVKNPTGLIWLILTVIVFAVDIASKFLIHSTFKPYESIHLLPFFSIKYARNTGAAFSILEGQRWLLAIIAILISLFIIYVLYKNERKKILENFSFALILGGALGNLLDRLYYGYVIDFIDVNFGTWHYPTFNIADCAICIGIMFFIMGNIKNKTGKKEKI